MSPQDRPADPGAALAEAVTLALPQDEGPIGVAVSGGSDSLATLLLLAARRPVAAVTVDHGLRPAGRTEAETVAALCAARGISHEILAWEPGAETGGNLMDRARRARMRLIGDWARARGIAHVALGHTADDEAETFVMRLTRASGLEGLAGMRRIWSQEGVTWHRPCLRTTRAELRDWLVREGLDWAEDPSNADPRFERVRARMALGALGPLGLGPKVLAEVIDHLADADAAICGQLAEFAAAHVEEQSGDLLIALEPFRALPHELRRRLMGAALRWISGAGYAPRGGKLEEFVEAPGERTLHGCRMLFGPGVLRLTREAGAVARLRVPAAEPWDRWRIEGPVLAGDEIGALGEEGLAHCPAWRETGLPRASLAASPALWRAGVPVAAPLAGAGTGFAARLVRPPFIATLFRR